MTRALSVVLIGVLVLSGAARAQNSATDRPTPWGIMAGGVGVTGGFRGQLSSGVVGDVEALFPLSSRRLSLRGDIMYHWIDTYHYGCRSGGIDPGFCGYVDTWSRVVSTTFSMVARMNDPATRWSPYVIAGVAAYLTGNTDEPLVALRPNHLGFQGGVGFEVRPSKHTYFVELRYLGIPSGGVLPLTIGMQF